MVKRVPRNPTKYCTLQIIDLTSNRVERLEINNNKAKVYTTVKLKPTYRFAIWTRMELAR